MVTDIFIRDQVPHGSPSADIGTVSPSIPLS